MKYIKEPVLITPFNKEVMSILTYQLVQKLLYVMIISGFIGHLLFYVVLKYVFDYKETFIGRSGVCILFLSLLLLSTKQNWSKIRIIYFDIVYGVTMPLFFTYMHILNDGNIYWSASLVFMSVLYGIVGHPVKVVIHYPLFVLGGIFTSYLLGFYTYIGLINLLHILFPAYFLLILIAFIHAIMIKAFHDLKETKQALVVSEKIAQMTLIFEKFVPKQFLKRIAAHGIEDIKLGNANTEEMVILFSDIRSFTSLCEKIKPQLLLDILNSYLDRMCGIIHKRNGFIDKYVGDAVLALFDLQNTDLKSSISNAIESAVEIQNSLREYNMQFKDNDIIKIESGIGIHCGEAIIGTIGSEDRMDSTVLGDVVNVASRIENLTKDYKSKIIISEQIYSIAKDIPQFNLRELDLIIIRGRNNIERIFEVLDAEPQEIVDKRKKSLPIYQKGLIDFRNRNINEAKKEFTQCLQIDSTDFLAQLYINRCNEFLNAIQPSK